MAQKYIAEGKSGCTYGLELDNEYYIQIKHPNGEYGNVRQIEKSGRFGWDYWVGKFDAEEIEEFPNDCDIRDLL